MATTPDYLANLEATLGMKHFLLADSSPMSLLWTLSGLQQAAFAEEVLAHPGLLRSVSREAIVRLYQTCRVGSPDAALKVLGKWAEMHPEAEPQFSADMHKHNCADYCVAAYSLAWQCPPHLDFLSANAWRFLGAVVAFQQPISSLSATQCKVMSRSGSRSSIRD